MSDYIDIDNADEFALSFESPLHLKEWILELHIEYDLEDVTELKQLFLDNEQYDLYMVIRNFEEKYIK